MQDPLSHPATAFAGTALFIAGPLLEVALAIKNADEKTAAPILAFDDDTGRVIDLDLRGSRADIAARLMRRAAAAAAAADSAPQKSAGHEDIPAPMPTQDLPAEPAAAAAEEARGRGRPKLGVVAREVTLLPRHWEWLSTQTGGASVTLRRLVEEARRSDIAGGRRKRRNAQEAAYRFMSAIAGDLPGYEEACRALFADDSAQFRRHIAQWPADVGGYAARLAFGAPL